MLLFSCGCKEKYWWEARSQKKGPFFSCVLKRIIAHLSSHKMPLSLSNGNINFFCILERRVMLTSSPSPGVFVYVKEGQRSVWLFACVCLCSCTVWFCVHVVYECGCWSLNKREDTRESFAGVGELCGRRRRVWWWWWGWEGELGGGALQRSLNNCESDFSNEGVTEAMNESACLCGSVGSLLTLSAFSAIAQEVAAPPVVMPDWKQSHVCGKGSQTHHQWDKTLCSLLVCVQKSSPIIAVFTLGICVLFVTRAAQSFYLHPRKAEVNWNGIVFL